MKQGSRLVVFLLLLFLILNEEGLRLYETDQLTTHRLARQATIMPDPAIVILGVDDEVFRLNRYNRREHARVVRHLTQAGVRQIFFDILFDEPRGLELDQPLVEAIAASGRVTVAGFYRVDNDRADLEVIRPQLFPELQALVDQGRCGLGIINTDTSAAKVDSLLGVLESTSQGGSLHLGAAGAMLAADFHLAPSDVEYVLPSRWLDGCLKIPPRVLEVTALPQGQLEVLKYPIRYHAPATGPRGAQGPDRIPVIPYLKVADGDPAVLAQLRSKFVLIGETTQTSNDTYPTPVGVIKGVEIHAQMLNTLLQDKAPRIVRPGSSLWFPVLTALTVVVMALAEGLRRQPHLLGCAQLLGGALLLWHGLVAYWDRAGVFLPQLLGYSMILAGGLAALVLRFMTLHQMLTTFVPKMIADQLMREEDIHQGAVEATVMVTDIRGYTSLSESRTPLQVLALLNDYHGETVALYQRFGGHVLNYQGDAQIILFGHPKALKDPARQAILAAQAASSAVARLRKRWKLPPDQPFNVGAGICTGKVIIAELGGEYREYTVIGELVRKCHKLQSQSQVLGANIILDEETYQCCRLKPPVERRDQVVIDGLPQPVTVYITDIVGREGSS